MKKIVIFALAVGLLSSCGADQATVDKMAGEMCAAMEMYNETDPMSLLDAANAMTEIAGKEAEYSKVTEDQLMKTMETSCPEGHTKFKNLAEGV